MKKRAAAGMLFGVFLVAARAHVRADSMEIAVDQPSCVQTGITQWAGVDDASALCRLTREGDGLRIVVTVKDDHVDFASRQPDAPHDGLELFFDLRPHRLRWKNLYEAGVFQLTIPAGEGPVTVALTGPHLPAGPRPTADRELFPGGYRIELCLSGEFLATWPTIVRERFGFDICINDVDAEPQATRLVAYGTLLNWRNPAGFQLVTLPR